MSTLHIPPSSSTVQVSIIDTTFHANILTAPFMGPPIQGFDRFQAIAYAFLVTHKDPATGKERRIVFDLGCAKELENDFPPSVVKLIKDFEGSVEVGKDVADILTEHGVELDSIEPAIWRQPRTFRPRRTAIPLPPINHPPRRPGGENLLLPRLPSKRGLPRPCPRVLQPHRSRTGFQRVQPRTRHPQALDYFGDGSFYLLSAPGHAVGHINALARTTENTFIYFAGDSFHHGSELRPHDGDGASLPRSLKLPGLCCSGSAFHAIHPVNDRSRIPEHYREFYNQVHDDPNKVPFHTLSESESGGTLAVDLRAARDTVSVVQRFDSDPDVFVIAAHDITLYEILEYFPKYANDWKEKGWKEEGYWLFLRDFTRAVELETGERFDTVAA